MTRKLLQSQNGQIDSASPSQMQMQVQQNCSLAAFVRALSV